MISRDVGQWQRLKCRCSKPLLVFNLYRWFSYVPLYCLSPTAIALGSSAIVEASGQNCFPNLYGSLGQICLGLLYKCWCGIPSLGHFKMVDIKPSFTQAWNQWLKNERPAAVKWGCSFLKRRGIEVWILSGYEPKFDAMMDVGNFILRRRTTTSGQQPVEAIEDGTLEESRIIGQELVPVFPMTPEARDLHAPEEGLQDHGDLVAPVEVVEERMVRRMRAGLVRANGSGPEDLQQDDSSRGALRHDLPGGDQPVGHRHGLPGGDPQVGLRRELPGGDQQVALRHGLPRGDQQADGLPGGDGSGEVQGQDNGEQQVGAGGTWPGGPMAAIPKAFGPTSVMTPGPSEPPLFDYQQLKRFQELYSAAPQLYCQEPETSVARPDFLDEEESELRKRLLEIEKKKKERMAKSPEEMKMTVTMHAIMQENQRRWTRASAWDTGNQKRRWEVGVWDTRGGVPGVTSWKSEAFKRRRTFGYEADYEVYDGNDGRDAEATTGKRRWW